MDIVLTQDQTDEFLEDGYINIQIGGYRVYLELDQYKNIWYFELVKSINGKTVQGYAHDVSQLDLLESKKPTDPSYWHNDPLCPHCGTYMIYQFECCPKCGQRLDWRERV